MAVKFRRSGSGIVGLLQIEVQKTDVVVMWWHKTCAVVHFGCHGMRLDIVADNAFTFTWHLVRSSRRRFSMRESQQFEGFPRSWSLVCEYWHLS